jgi:mono/diheme cytochrome c family protein
MIGPFGVISRQLRVWAALLLLVLPGIAAGQKIAATRVWNDKDLAEWANPIAALKVRPGHYSERDYYSATPAEWVRTYPVYFPGREPRGYWEMLQNKKPEALVRSGARTKVEWVKAGQIAFREMDVAPFRSYDPDLIAIVRSPEEFSKAGGRAQTDGTVAGMRWVPTSKGLALSIQDCSGCHTRVMPDGSYLDGAPANISGNGVIGRLVNDGLEMVFAGERRAMWNWRNFVVPWISKDIHQGIKSMQPAELASLRRSNIQGTFPRFNGSPYYTTKIPDLIGIADQRYIDHTATHRLRNAGDLMRYAALVTCCDSADFGPHRILSDKQRTISFRFPDEVLFALGEYIYSLKPPDNPNAGDPRIGDGKKVFVKQGCGACHTPPFYTNRKLTLAEGYTPPKDHPLSADIMALSVNTDPGLALKTRKGTGFYKVPSLRGVWYRGLYNHDGSVASLEAWFDAARLREDYVPTGFKGYGVKNRSLKGHEFGLHLTPREKAALIAFLKSL